MIVKFANKIGQLHGRFFMWLGKKAESHPLWALALTVWALYEIAEHIAGPILAVMYATGYMTFK